MNNAECCATIYMTNERFLKFHCTKCSFKSFNFGDILHHFTEHWSDYNVRTAIKIANEPDFNNENKTDNENTEVQQQQQIIDIVKVEDEGPYEMIEYLLDDYDQETNDRVDGADDGNDCKNDKEKKILKAIFKEAIKADNVGNTDPLTELNATKTQQVIQTDKLSTIKTETSTINNVDTNSMTPEEKINHYVNQTKDGLVYKCGNCDAFFPTAHRLKIHERSHSSDRNFVCKFCGFAFKELFNLRVHLRRHTGKKRFKCEHCMKMFITRSEMLTHERRHTGERPFICSECGLGFVSSGALHIHTKRHSNEREHKCEVCAKEFYDSYQLRDHMAVHTSERNHICDVCEATFARLKSLKAHKKLHENKREYVCNICQAAFNQKPSLTMHLRNTHRVLKGGIVLREQKNKINEMKNKKKEVNSSKKPVKNVLAVSCDHCQIEFPNMITLLQHIEKVHDGQAIICDQNDVLQAKYIEEIKMDNVEITTYK